MTSLRRLTPLLLLALIPLGACGRTSPGQAVAASATVPNVGVAPERPAAAAAVPAVPAVTTTQPRVTTTQPDETTEPEDTEVDATDPDDTVATGSGGVETDPARREWLEFAEEEADPESFAGGAALEDLVDGNRVLMIGDSVMASTSSRYGGEMCDSVVETGWDVEIDAETGRFIDFGDKVLDQRLDAGFDVVVIMLGNNYGANPDVFEEYFRDLVERLDDRPVILSTVTVFQPNRTEVNNILYDIAQDSENIRVLDWAGETEENAALTGGDGLHLSDLGRARFAELVAEELGDAPGSTSRDGECLRSSFTDDSVGQGNTGPLEGQVTMPSNSIPTNTNRPTQTTVTVPGSAESSVPDGSTPGGGTGGTTPPTGVTVPEPTAPPTQATPAPTVPTIPLPTAPPG